MIDIYLANIIYVYIYLFISHSKLWIIIIIIETKINAKEIKLHDIIKDMIIPRKKIFHFQWKLLH